MSIYTFLLLLNVSLTPQIASENDYIDSYGDIALISTQRPGSTSNWRFRCTGGGYKTVTPYYKKFDGKAGHILHHNNSRPSPRYSPSTIRVKCDSKWRYLATLKAPNISGLTKVTWRWSDGTVHLRNLYVKESGLSKLPSSPYIDQIGLTASLSENLLQNHPENHWSKPQLNSKVLAIAKTFYEKHNKKLLVNDMSLPWGGILDFKDNWSAPHQTHQTGTHVDIQKDGVMTKEEEKTFFRAAVKQFGSIKSVCVHCRHWHISMGKQCRNIPCYQWRDLESYDYYEEFTPLYSDLTLRDQAIDKYIVSADDKKKVVFKLLYPLGGNSKVWDSTFAWEEMEQWTDETIFKMHLIAPYRSNCLRSDGKHLIGIASTDRLYNLTELSKRPICKFGICSFDGFLTAFHSRKPVKKQCFKGDHYLYMYKIIAINPDGKEFHSTMVMFAFDEKY